MKLKPFFIVIAALAFSGAVISGFSLVHHYSTSQDSFCNLSQTVNCDIVNRSIYSMVGPVPVALIGVLGYLALLALATLYRESPQTPDLLFWGSLAGLIFALRLTYIEGFVLGAWCILCLASLELIFDIFVFSAIIKFRSTKSDR